jgi:hypothetical protein
MTTAAELSARVTRAVGEHVPDDVVARAKGALARRLAPGSLAHLDRDLEGEPRRLHFTHPEVSIDVTVRADGEQRAVLVHAEPAVPLAIEPDEGASAGPVDLTDGAPFTAHRGDLVRVAAGGARSEWFRV